MLCFFFLFFFIFYFLFYFIFFFFNDTATTEIYTLSLHDALPISVKYIPFEPNKHNTLKGIKAEMPGVTDAFVGAAWLVENGEPKPADYFNFLQGADGVRFRAFWGMNKLGIPVIGVSAKKLDSARLAKVLTEAGFQDAVMLDSGASTSLVYKGKSLVGLYTSSGTPCSCAGW